MSKELNKAPAEQAGGDEREAKPGLFCRDCGDRLAVRGVCSIYCPKCEKGDGGSDSSGVPAEAAAPASSRTTQSLCGRRQSSSVACCIARQS